MTKDSPTNGSRSTEVTGHREGLDDLLQSLDITMEELRHPSVLLETDKGKRFLETPDGLSYAREFAPQYLPGDEGRRCRIMQKMMKMKPGDEISREELDFLEAGGASTPVEVTGNGAGAFSAEQREIVVGGRVQMMRLQIQGKPGVTPISGTSVSARMDLDRLVESVSSEEALELMLPRLGVGKILTPMEIARELKVRANVEADEELILEAARKAWPDYDSLAELRTLPLAVRLISVAPDKYRVLTPSRLKEELKKQFGIEADEELVLSAAKRRWPDYDGGTPEKK